MWTTLSTFGWTIRLLAALAAAMIGLVITIRYAAPVYADESKLYLDCPTTEVREGDSVDVFLVRVTNHDHWWEYFGAYWFTDAGTAGTDDYEDGSGPIRWSYDAERAANRAIHTFEIRQDALVEGNETFTVRTDEGDIADLNDPDRDNKCDITIIDDAPNITEVAVTSSAGRDNTYGLGETIEISATFSTSVEVNGNPALGFWAGTWKGASYLRGSGSNTLVFGYTVKSDDRDGNGISMDGGYQDSNGTWHNFVNHTAVTAVGTDTVAYRVYRGLDQQSGHKVDGSLMPVGTGMEITSEPADGDTYRYGETIDIALTLSAPVDVEGAKNLNARVGTSDGTGTWRGPVYKSGSGTNTLVFGYTVQTRDLDTDGIAIGANKLTLNGGAIKDAAENDAALTHDAVAADSRHKVEGSDTTAPTVSSVAITSDPGGDDTYRLGDAVEVTVTFSEDVTVTGTLLLELDFDGTAKTASYRSTSGADVMFNYTVARDESDADGIAIGADKLSLNEGTIKDGADNAATLTHDAVAADSGHKVDGSDTTAPTISSLSFTSDPGDDRTYGTGDTIQVAVTFSENVIITGTPQLELNMSGSASSARQASYSSSNSSGADVVFEYTVAVGDRASDGLEIKANKLTLNDGTIQDASGNDATLTHSNFFVPSDHFVNGAGGLQ